MTALDLHLPPAPDYREFLESKFKFSRFDGFELDPAELHQRHKPHQRDIITWAVRKGRAAIFARFGLGKTDMQLGIADAVAKRRGGRQLIVAPYDVHQEFEEDAAALGMEFRVIRSDAEADRDGLYLTNYEPVRDGKFDLARFNMASLDEAAVLRSYGSKTYQEFLPLFGDVEFRYVATAAPSPNRYKELIHYAGFLGVMDTGQALTRFFQRDSTQANNLTLYPHMTEEFHLWLHSWAVFLQAPSDLGYSDEGYDLPPFEIRWHEIKSDTLIGTPDRDGQGVLIRDAAAGIQEAAAVKRDTVDIRIAKMMDLIGEAPRDHYLLWHDLEAEREAIEAALPTAKSVYGSLDFDERKARLLDFKHGRSQFLPSKPLLSGAGCNFQRHCHRAIFVGIGHKFHDLIQAIHRIVRFQQTQACTIDLIYTEDEREIRAEVERKWQDHDALAARMQAILRGYGLSTEAFEADIGRTIGVDRIVAKGERYEVARNDCVLEARLKADCSVDEIITSIPFGNHYEYTESYEDFGHNDDNRRFFEQMDFLTPELLRILKPGRMACIHVKDRVQFGNVTGYGFPSIEPFHADCIAHFRRHGFIYCGAIHVNTDVVRENNGTYRLGWSENAKDSTKMGVGCPEYVLLFRKMPSDHSKSYADEPVTKEKPMCRDITGDVVPFDKKLPPVAGTGYSRSRWQIDAHAFWRSSGNRLPTPDEMAALGPNKLAKLFPQWSLQRVYDYDEHVRLGEELDARFALPSEFMALAPGSHDPDTWHDVVRMRTLNSVQRQRNLVNHVCLARGSLVLTKRGFVQIQDVIVGDLVLSHRGLWRPVQVVANTGIRPVVDLRAQGVAALSLTPDHKLWTRKSDWARARDGAVRAEPAWVRADETVGAYVNLKLPPVEECRLTDQECWLLGRWLADGHVGTRGDFFVSIGPDKLDEFLRVAGKYAGTRAIHTAVQIRLKGLSSALIAALGSCGRGAGGKQVPLGILAAPEPQARAALEGYLSGDGHFLPERSRWMASSISRALLLGLAMLVQRVHCSVASLHAGRPAGHAIIEGRKVITRQEWVLSFDAPGPRRKSQFILDDGAWKKVRCAEPAGEAETWCLRVAEDESFTAEGAVVKNCPLQLDIVERLIERYSNPGELIFDPFGGIMTVPYCAVKAGRLGAASELNADYFRDGLTHLRSVEVEATTPSLFDLLDAEAAE